MLSDVGALALSFFAIRFARRPATSARTYGYHRAEILAALANGAALVAIAILILIEAYRRFREPQPVMGSLMATIAVGGLLVNLASLWILHSGKDESLNVRGAWLHVLTDALGSVGAILAAVLIWAFSWNLADPIISAVIALLVVYSSWELMRESADVLMGERPAAYQRRRGAPGNPGTRWRPGGARPAHLDDHQRHGCALGPRGHRQRRPAQ